jgi:hypothetical protein
LKGAEKKWGDGKAVITEGSSDTQNNKKILATGYA